jgi:hypothetical protein
MTDWQDRDNGDAVLDGWYAILVSWGTPWEEDTPDVLLFRDGAWVQRQKDCSLPNFYYFQGPFQSSMEARDWGHAHDGVGKYFAERAEEALRARAALAQPEPQGPTDYELAQLFSDSNRQSIKDACSTPEHAVALIRSHMGYARAALARWGRPAIEPVPVSERWPEFSDCNSFEEVWAFNPVLDHWKLTRINRSIHTHWLPYWALPVLGVEGADG